MQTLRKRNGGDRLEESSQLDVEPAKYFVLVTKREKRACRSCEDLGVVSAPLPPRIIEKCLASDRIVIDTVVSKYCDHLPLHRQEHDPGEGPPLGNQPSDAATDRSSKSVSC